MPDLKFKPHRARLRHRALQEPQRLFFLAVPVGLVIASVALFALAGVAAWPAILFLLLLYLLAGRRLVRPRNKAARHPGSGGAALSATVIPFLLRGVNLLGIDSVTKPYEARQRAWQRLATDLPVERLETMISPATLADLPQLGADILKGRVKGRIVVDVNA